ncbi:MAG: lysophospholipid acyltransferase family protein [bacterium]
MRTQHQADPEFLRKLSPAFRLLEKYFRYEVHGLDHIPAKRCLVVMNHGIIPFHGFLLAWKLLQRRKLMARGLGADFLFQVPGLRELFLKGGAVQADPRNAERLLKQDHIVMLAPGGIYEALIAKSGLRRIPWERRKGFVRLAIKTQTPIVPTYCRGINSAYFNSYFLLKPRIKLLERLRFSVPFFMGLGLLPFPMKLVHWVGRPISIKRRRGESAARHLDRVHGEVLAAVAALARRDLRHPK